MPKCAVCHTDFALAHSWNHLFLLIEEKRLCFRCEKSLVEISGAICKVCGRRLEKEGVCSDCKAWESQKKVLVKNRSIYIYNEGMKEVMNQFKFRGDIEVIHAFASEVKALFQKEFSDVDDIVPVPLSMERLYERGFNQSEAIASLIGRNVSNLLVKAHQEKQSKKGKFERIKEQNPFSYVGSRTIKGKKILLIDDIYTTGTTLRNCAAVLLEAGAESCSSFTLVRS